MSRYLLMLVLGISVVCSLTAQTPSEASRDLNRKILRGWNTWNNPSVLSHVHMPDGLNLQFIFRKTRGGPYWLTDAYVASPKYKFAEKIRPLEHALDGSYTALTLEWEGVDAMVQSATDGEDILLLYTPRHEVEQPHILALRTGFLWNKPGSLVRSGDSIVAKGPVRTTTVHAIGRQSELPLPLSTPHLTFSPNEEIAVYTGRQRSLEEIKALIADRKAKLKAKNARFGELAGLYEGMQSLVGWNLFYNAHHDRPIASVSRIWNEAWGGHIIFDWDTYFIALLATLENKDLAYANVYAITQSITDGGFIPNVSATFVTSNDRSQPPVGALATKLIYDRYGERAFLAEVYDELLTWNRWWPKARDNQGYLSWGSHPHPEGMEGHTLKAAKWESGLDNSPLFDEAVFNEEKNTMELASVGLLALHVADCNYLAEIADVLGKSEDAAELRARSIKYGQKLTELWDEDMGFYRDKDLKTGQFTDHKAPTHFYPLLAGTATQQQAERMVNEHLLNPGEFYGDYMIPSISRDDPGFADNSYWRGRIWAPMNFLVYLGLRNYELPEARRVMAEKSKLLFLGEWEGKRRIHENYNATTGQGDDVRNSDPFYAWGGLLALIGLMEEGHF